MKGRFHIPVSISCCYQYVNNNVKVQCHNEAWILDSNETVETHNKV